MQLLPNKVILFNPIKEAYDIETQDRQEEIMFFSATTARQIYKDHSYRGIT